jgi:hypothetical protein
MRTPDAATTAALKDTNRRALISRWNAAVDAVHASNYFRWSSIDQFPHSTYMGGTAQAYEQFAAILLKFLQVHFDFLASESLLQTRLLYVLPTDTDVFGTFQELATQMAKTSVGDIPAQTREQLAGFAHRM